MTVGVPSSIRHLLEQQVTRLRPADQELLAAASVAGVEFAVAAVAAGVQQTGEDVEVQCDTWPASTGWCKPVGRRSGRMGQ